VAIQPPERDTISRAVLLLGTAGPLAVGRASAVEQPNTGTQFPANLANLMARASVKSREVAIRISLGGTGGRLLYARSLTETWRLLSGSGLRNAPGSGDSLWCRRQF
jgi:hypothetical protein